MGIFITGGLGFIGSHTACELLNEGKEVIIADNLSNSKPYVLENIKKASFSNKSPLFYKGNVDNRDFLRSIFKENQIDSVIHFAGFKAVGESCKYPLKYYSNNIASTISLLEVMQEFNCRKLVFSSSATVYDKGDPIPYVEGYKTGASSPYGWTKIMSERIIKDVFNSDKSFSAVLLRYFNPVGAHHSGFLGEDPDGIPNNLFPYIEKVASGELPFLNIFGNDYPTADGTGIRDYIHVEDLAKGHIRALDFLEKNSHCLEEINLGTGKGTSVLELVRIFEKVNGVKIPLKFVKRRPGDIAEFYSDSRKAERLLNWKAEKNLEDMCRDGWNYTVNKK